MDSEQHTDYGGATPADAQDALDRARLEMASGSIERAWLACCRAAEIGRALGDADIVAGAATAISGPLIASHHLTAARQALCLEALALLPHDDQVRRRRVETQLRAISTGWSASPALPEIIVSPLQAEERIAEIHAEHAAALRPDAATERVEIATRLRSLAQACARDDQLAWASLWRMDALAQLGRRVELNADFIELGAIERRLDSPIWGWRIALVRACLALMDDHIEDVGFLAADAARRGREAGVDDAPFLDLVLRSELAIRTGDGLAEVENEVRVALADAPFFAQSWRAKLLVALHREDEAIEIWRALAPHIDELPPTVLEWLVATTAHAELSILSADSGTAARLYDMLTPYRTQHNMSVVMSPYGGPVSLTLGRLARHLGYASAARVHYTQALAQSEEMHAPWYSRAAREALNDLGIADTQLSPREAQVAELVAAGFTNREIAARLFLSERTVESHVSSALRRLGVPNRAAVAARISRLS